MRLKALWLYVQTSNSLADAELQGILAQLPVRALAALACACKALRDATYSLDRAWHDCARAYLVGGRPTVLGANRAAVQHQLQQHATAVANLQRGHSTGTVQLEDTPNLSKHHARFSPDGEKIAVLAVNPLVVHIFDTGTGSRLGGAEIAQRQDGISGPHDPLPAPNAWRWTADCRQIVGLYDTRPQQANRPSLLIRFRVDVCTCTPSEPWIWSVGSMPLYRSAVLSSCGSWGAVISFSSTAVDGFPLVQIDIRSIATGSVWMTAHLDPGTAFDVPCWSCAGPSLVLRRGPLINIQQKTVLAFSEPADDCIFSEFSLDGCLLAVASTASKSRRNQCDRRPNTVYLLDAATAEARHRIEGKHFLGFLGSGSQKVLIRDCITGHHSIYEPSSSSHIGGLPFEDARPDLALVWLKLE